MRQSVLLLFLGVLLVPLFGCDKKTESAAMPAPLVEVMTVEARTVPMNSVYIGQTAGSRTVEIRAQVSGILVSRDYEEGRFVEKNQLLFQIEPDTYKAALAQAEGVRRQAQAKFTQADQDLKRIRNLYARNAISQRDRDSAQAAYDSAKADLFSAKAAVDKAKIELDYAYVRSPIKGFASKEQRSIGNLINAASSTESLLTTVTTIDPIFANFSVPSPQIMRIRTLHEQGRLKMDNVRAHMELADGSVYQTPGKVIFVDASVNPNTSVLSARAEFPNARMFVLPGQFVRLTMSGLDLLNAILVPQKAIIQTQQGSMVVVVTPENKAEMRPVVLSDCLGEAFLLEKGLASGERIIVEGVNKAVPGQPVRIAQKQNAPAAASLPEAKEPRNMPEKQAKD